MGCVNGRPNINDTHKDVFEVKSLDEQGQELCDGQIKVTDTTVTFYVKGRQPMEWPLRSIRRYGAENGIFCFESGRRCPTGPRYCAFKCQRAESLLKLLQTYVRSTSTTRGGLHPGSNPEGDRPPDLLDRQQSEDSLQPVRSASGLSHSGTSNSLLRSRLASLDLAEGTPEYANVNCNGTGPQPPEANGYVIPNTPGVTMNTPPVAGREYENVGIPDTKRTHSLSIGLNTMTHSSSIIDSMHQSRRSPGGPKSAPLNGIFFPACEDFEELNRQINYIDVEFDHSHPKSPTVNGAKPTTTVGIVPKRCAEATANNESTYSKIDIDRTVALSKTATQQNQRALDPGASDSPAGVRKTRHNSTLSELNSNLVEGMGLLSLIKRNSVIED
eukprot:snap_masked-scaffold12_size759060-processed-gene-5.9 protein:Tk05586 transcript:snap_masked-scaffold12_size759060-processed-gene-5.9-mRNA-1 annotation:"fibroblast growth factor receptor substrate 2"